MRKYRVVKKWYSGVDFYEIQYKYPYWPFWLFFGTRVSLEQAIKSIAKEKATLPDPKPKVVHRE